MGHGSDLNFCERCNAAGLRTPIPKGERFCDQCKADVWQEQAHNIVDRKRKSREPNTAPSRLRTSADLISGFGLIAGIAFAWTGFEAFGPVTIAVGVGVAVQGFWLAVWCDAAAEALESLADIRKILKDGAGRVPPNAPKP